MFQVLMQLLGDLGSSGSGCPVPGPQMANNGPLSCFSSCCSSAGACAGGALPAGGGGCPGNANAGPNSAWYNGICPNIYVSGTGVSSSSFIFDHG